MGKKSKTMVKSTNKMTKGHPIDAANLKISELCLEEFEKSLASMLESLSSKKIEILQTCAYNSKSDPSAVIGKINAKYILDEDESVESLQQKIITAANPDVYLNTKLVAVKSNLATSSDTTNSSQDETLKGRCNHGTKADETCVKSRQENTTTYRPRRLAHSDPRENKKNYKQSITPPQRGTFHDLRKSFSDCKKRINGGRYMNENANEGLNNSFSHFKNYKELIEMNPNIYMKANKHFIIDELSLETILEKIYLEAYSFEDLREYVYSALKKVVSLDDFLDILYSSIQNYSLRVKEHIMEALDEVMIKTKRLVKGNNGYSEIIHEFGGYRKFSKYCTVYTGIVNKIYEAYKSLELITLEIEKVCALYLNRFCKEKVRFSCADFHKRIFAKYFYNDPWIRDFLDTIAKYFEEKHFYASKYPTAVSQIFELSDCLDRLDQSCSDSELEGNGECNQDGEEFFRDDERVRVSLTVEEELFKKMMQQRDLIDAGIDDNEEEDENGYLEGEAETVNTKAKKKRNKKKKKAAKNNAEANTAEQTPNNDGKEKENLPLNKNKNDLLIKGPIKQNTGNVKLDNEVEAFEKQLDMDIEQANTKNERIKPNISDEWVQSLRQRLHKMNKLF